MSFRAVGSRFLTPHSFATVIAALSLGTYVGQHSQAHSEAYLTGPPRGKLCKKQRSTKLSTHQKFSLQSAGWLNGSDRNHVLLVDLPRTALPADVRRLCAKQRFDHVSKGEP